jgi:uridine kinase
VVDARTRLVHELAARARGARRIAVDGPDAAGKTTLAQELAAALAHDGLAVVRVSIDDFLRPREERYRLGDESPTGYYEDSFDHDRFREAVMDARETVIADGVFLQRPEIVDLWDFCIFVDAEEKEILRRAANRDRPRLGGGVVDRYRRRYLPAQRAYAERLRPAERADAVVDNTDPAQPVLRR